MLNAQSFLACITQQLTERGLGAKRIAALTEKYQRAFDNHVASGATEADASMLASTRILEDLEADKARKAKTQLASLQMLGRVKSVVEQARSVDTSLFAFDGPNAKGREFGAAVMSMLAYDPRFKGLNYTTLYELHAKQMKSFMAQTWDEMGKGTLGVQRGSAHLDNVVRAHFGDASDPVASRAFDGFNKATAVGVDLINRMGGSLRKMERYFPQPINSAAKLMKGGMADFVAKHADWLDWNKTRWADGSPIPEDMRVEFLENVYKTLVTNGANKIKPDALRGFGSSTANMLEDRRMLYYKDADAWLSAHKDYGDGNTVDLMDEHIDWLANKIASLQVMGPSPTTFRSVVHNTVRRALQNDPQALKGAEGHLKNRFDQTLDVITHRNPMDPENVLAAGVVGTSNILNAAQLGSAFIPAVFGDTFTAAFVRRVDGLPVFPWLGELVRGMAHSGELRTAAADAGMVADDVVQAGYALTRFTGITTYGPSASRTVSDKLMRASWLSRWTQVARLAPRMEFLTMFARERAKSFADLDWRAMAERHGISEADWDAFRAGPVYTHKGREMLRPIDRAKEDATDPLYFKFQSMVLAESKLMVLDSTTEASVLMKGATRPDTLYGAVLHSFAMYKNFPVTFAMSMGRLTLAQPSKQTRIGMIAGLGVGMTMAGALAIQTSEILSGRDPQPMNDAKFLARAMLKGGALSIWGDFLASGTGGYGRGAAGVVAGPLAGAATDVLGLTFGELVEAFDDKGMKDKPVFARLVEFAKRNTPGTNLWYARLLLEREIWDNLQMLADPRAHEAFRRKEAARLKATGNEFYWHPGDSLPERAPSAEGVW